MNKYNDLLDFLIPIIYEGKTGTWEEMREKADLLLNEMRKDLGTNTNKVTYKGNR
jgi:hypothetical protein